MASVGFEPTISAGMRHQTYALDRSGRWDRQPAYMLGLKYMVKTLELFFQYV